MSVTSLIYHGAASSLLFTTKIFVFDIALGLNFPNALFLIQPILLRQKTGVLCSFLYLAFPLDNLHHCSGGGARTMAHIFGVTLLHSEEGAELGW